MLDQAVAALQQVSEAEDVEIAFQVERNPSSAEAETVDQEAEAATEAGCYATIHVSMEADNRAIEAQLQ